MTKKSTHPLYSTWRGMMDRCYNPKNDHYKDYGGRGITVCPRWHDFENFVEDMHPKPSSNLSLDRENNHLGYSPANCRWASARVQNLNKRTSLPKLSSELSIKDIAREYGAPYNAIARRVKMGRPFDDILDTYYPWTYIDERCAEIEDDILWRASSM